MTFDERVRALEHLGFSEPQTRFIVTVALHSGFCLRRHYATLTGLKYGAGVRGFLDRLVARGLARRHDFRPDRGHVYHLHHASIYNSIGQDDNRNRRHTSPALVARKLMLLDYVLDHPDTEWVSTEHDKVALFTTQFGVPFSALPHRIYFARRPGKRISTTTRYFVHKLPTGVQPNTSIVTFVVLITDTGGQLLSQFMEDHLPLLGFLARWRVVAVLPGHVAGQPACEAVFKRLSGASASRRSARKKDDLRLAFRVHDLVVSGEGLATVSIAEIDRFRNIRDSYSQSEFARLFSHWKASGGAVLEDVASESFERAITTGRGQFEIHRLPIRYDRFGTRAGVS